ncbi:sensor domain-containing diguanylate cyclase [Solemya velum gill symbiont]|uniref:sensor domain-containing diguanylate cyclase n=1 Tax=Solemya velum gill symbiont TaxID=2340 RepID=UPI000995E397|nr:diguanylate cyclase [Solemya velum gill symbiont]
MHVTNDETFYISVLNSLTQQIAVIVEQGLVQWVNHSWKAFSEENRGQPDKTWRNTNYIRVCSDSVENGDQDAVDALAGIEAVIRGEEPIFYFEYPCHSPDEQRWFMMHIRPLDQNVLKHFVITHQNIAERKLAEQRVEEMAVLDGLTGIANRRHFDDFLKTEWRRALRLGHPVSIALLDIDHFKPYNDNYGHVAGDECLRRVGKTLKHFSRRPGDLVARYGGEEFAIILGDTGKEVACQLAEEIRAAILALDIHHEYATRAKCVTVSIGVATLRPDAQSDMVPLGPHQCSRPGSL